MDKTERAEALRLLALTREQFLTACADVSEAQSLWRPAPDRWSIRDCAEHVALAENGMGRLIAERAVPHTREIAPGRESSILANGTDRSQKRAAPERSRPTGRFATLAEAAEEFAKARQRTMEFMGQTAQDLRAVDVDHASFGRITAQECLALLTIHPGRHALQIHELRNDPNFPA